MKTINQVLLAFIFVAFSTVGFAQSQITIPTSTVKLNDDIKFIDYTDEDDEDDDAVETDVEAEEAFVRTLSQRGDGNNIQNLPNTFWIPKRD